MPKENSLLQEIGHLKKQVQALERQNSSSVLENVSSVDKNLISEKEGVKEMVVKEMMVFDSGVNEEMKKPKNKRISSLRNGSEGVEVHGQCRSACISS
ncbi:hypothetical protein IFM89_017978 [Coptis chinensis]|uniref:Uncharacterized protein n=1 Tax=Coptis chinensis TaxID=261450 RepID=A0A835LS90_9MAGN|nr:hypothetical protein IFM89_017978 [Coptis chinensis]